MCSWQVTRTTWSTDLSRARFYGQRNNFYSPQRLRRAPPRHDEAPAWTADRGLRGVRLELVSLESLEETGPLLTAELQVAQLPMLSVPNQSLRSRLSDLYARTTVARTV